MVGKKMIRVLRFVLLADNLQKLSMMECTAFLTAYSKIEIPSILLIRASLQQSSTYSVKPLYYISLCAVYLNI